MTIQNETVIDEHGNLVGYYIKGGNITDTDDIVKFFACGDTGAVRKLEKVIIDKGPQHVIGEMQTVLKTADIRYINLEAVFSNEGSPLNKVPVFMAKPETFSLVKEINPTVVCLANNHISDYGPLAFNKTVQLLTKYKFSYFGAGSTYAEAKKPVVIEMNNIRIGFVGFREKESKGFDHNGVITPEIDTMAVLQCLDDLKPRTDIIILSLHFGWEYQFYPAPKDVKMCRSFIDHGATIILGHHPHYPQGVEIYNNGLICYSLGNFIWDQNFVGHTDSSYAIEIGLCKKGIAKAKVIPYKMDRGLTLKVLRERSSFNELDAISQILKDHRKLNEKWYFISRDKLIIFGKSLRDAFNKKGNLRKSLKHALKSCNTHRFKYTAASMLLYIVSLRFIYYELFKIFRRLSKNYTNCR